MNDDIIEILSDDEKEVSNRVVNTAVEGKDGQNKCPKCGATDISVNTATGKLRCNFCRYEFNPNKVKGFEEDLQNLKGTVIGSGAQDIVADTKEIYTFKCSSCGAEVVVDTNESKQARCHWCRNTLSVNDQIPNGSVPDVILPFMVPKEVAQGEMKNFAKKRMFFAHPKFKKEFTLDNIMGVYFPYMLVDANVHAKLYGEGEIETNKHYNVGSDNNVEYDADLYRIGREFDLSVHGLSIESSKDKLNHNLTNTNNVINAVMPFDVENCSRWDVNYLKGFSSEKRDVNVEELKDKVLVQTKDVVRHSCNRTIEQYDRGVCWEKEDVSLIGEQWKTAYLPVWLYSYHETKGKKELTHYIAVNGRNKKTMGSIPIHMPKLIIISLIIEFIGIFIAMNIDWQFDYLFLLTGIIFFIIMYFKYRNSNQRFNFETDTKTEIHNLVKEDKLVKQMKHISRAKMTNSNNTRVEGTNVSNRVFDSISGIDIKEKLVNHVTENNAAAAFVKDQIDKQNNKNKK